MRHPASRQLLTHLYQDEVIYHMLCWIQLLYPSVYSSHADGRHVYECIWIGSSWVSDWNHCSYIINGLDTRSHRCGPTVPGGRQEPVQLDSLTDGSLWHGEQRLLSGHTKPSVNWQTYALQVEENKVTQKSMTWWKEEETGAEEYTEGETGHGQNINNREALRSSLRWKMLSEKIKSKPGRPNVSVCVIYVCGSQQGERWRLMSSSVGQRTFPAQLGCVWVKLKGYHGNHILWHTSSTSMHKTCRYTDRCITDRWMAM